MNKETVKETVIKTESIEYDGAIYSYGLMKHESSRVSSYRIPLYSIEISFTDTAGNTTSAQTGELFSNINKAFEFYDKMVRNLATPIDLVYVVEDEMG